MWHGCASQYFETSPIHISGLWKNGPIHILDCPKCWPIHILPFDFFTHLLLAVRQLSQSTRWMPREQEAPKNLWSKNIRIYRDVRKVGPFIYESRKIGSDIYFLLKKGCYHIPGSAEKVGHSARTSVLFHIKEVTPPPPPTLPSPPRPPPPPTSTWICNWAEKRRIQLPVHSKFVLCHL